MKKTEIDKIVKSQINNGLIHPNDGAKKEGFEMGLLYVLKQGLTLPVDSVSNMFSEEQMEEAYTDGKDYESGFSNKSFNIENYR
jgi:hypothetical protein